MLFELCRSTSGEGPLHFRKLLARLPPCSRWASSAIIYRIRQGLWSFSSLQFVRWRGPSGPYGVGGVL